MLSGVRCDTPDCQLLAGLAISVFTHLLEFVAPTESIKGDEPRRQLSKIEPFLNGWMVNMEVVNIL